MITQHEVLHALQTQEYPHTYIVRMAEKMVIEQALILHRGNQTKVAKHLNINRCTLRKRIAEFRTNKVA